MSDNIYQRINTVMKAVKYVQKDAEVQGYKAVTHDMVTAVLRPELIKAGIAINVDQLRSELLTRRDPKAGEKMHLYSGDYAVHFVNIESPEDRVTVTVNAHANDNGDKAPGKAMSYAVKYAMLKTFSLETGENDEARFSDPYTPEQFEVYHDLLQSEKAYEFFMFTATLPQETLAGLYNSFPDGKKVQGKKAVQALEAAGREKFAEVVDDVQKRLAQHDISVIEITGEMNAVEKKLLASRLSDFEIQQLKKLSEAAA